MRTLGTLAALFALIIAGCTREESSSRVISTAAAPNAAPVPVSPQAAPLDSTPLTGSYRLGPAVVVENLTVWPVFTDSPEEVGEFLTLWEAMNRGLAEVREKGGPMGEVSPGQRDPVDPQVPPGQRDPRDPQVPPERRRPVQQEVPPGQRDPRDPQAPPEYRGPAGEVPPGQRDPVDPQCPPGQRSGRGGATVGKLVIENRAELPILVCAGTVVKGGQQDRQIPQDVVVLAGTTVDVDAFCVEQGRWTSTRMGRATAQRFDVSVAQAGKSVRAKGQYDADQSGVWEEVSKARGKFAGVAEREMAESEGPPIEAMENLRANASSSSLAVAQDAARELSGKKLAAAAGKVNAHFASCREGREGREAPVGFAYAVNGVVEGARVFAHSRLFEQQFDSFLNGICFEAHLARSDVEEPYPVARPEDVAALIAEIRKGSEERRETAGANWNGLRKGDAGFASRCYARSPADEDAPDQSLVITEDWTRK